MSSGEFILSRSAERKCATASEPDFSQLSDEDLMVLLRNGESAAMTPLFQRHRRLLLSIALRILHDQGEAEELVQDVFFEIYRKIDRFDPCRGSAKLWIMQFAYTRSINRRRDLTLRKFYDQAPLPVGHPNGADAAGPNAHFPALCELTAEERVLAMRRALKELPEKQRIAVELTCFEGLLMKEVAERMDESLVNARNHYYRGLRKLHALVNKRAPQPLVLDELNQGKSPTAKRI